MQTLTKENAEDGLTIQNKNHPDWGKWQLERTTAGHWVIHSGRRHRQLAPGEFYFWEVV